MLALLESSLHTYKTDQDKTEHEYSTNLYDLMDDEFGEYMVRVRSHAKLMRNLMFGILALTIDQLMRSID